MKERLRVGVLLNDYQLPYWEYKIIEQLFDSDYSKILVAIRNKLPISPVNKKDENGFIKLIEKTDKLVFKQLLDYETAKDASIFFKDSVEIDLDLVYSSKNILSNSFRDISILNLDVILKFGFHKSLSELLTLAKYGVWTYSIDDADYNDEIQSCLWEVVKNESVTNSALMIVKGDSGERETIFSSWESTCPFSITKNRNKIYWRASLFVPRVLEGLYNHGDSFLNLLKANSSPKNIGKVTRTGMNRNISNFLFNVTSSVFKKIIYTDAFNWQLSFEIKQRNSYPVDFSSFKRISPPKGVFWADPFVVVENDKYFLFVEEFIYKKNKAHISVLSLDKSGQVLKSVRIIERPYHMSYPFIFKIDGTFYMIPETSRNRTIQLFKCTAFPDKWEFVKNVMTGLSAVDSTVFYHAAKWWLFTSIDQTDNSVGNSTELFLFFTDDIFSGEWHGHPVNPVISDIRKARMAGKIFVEEGMIIRPSQDCSVRYGRGFSLNQITKLSMEEYEEKEIIQVEPFWDKNIRGTHTFNFDKDFTVIDIYSFRNRLE